MSSFLKKLEFFAIGNVGIKQTFGKIECIINIFKKQLKYYFGWPWPVLE